MYGAPQSKGGGKKLSRSYRKGGQPGARMPMGGTRKKKRKK